MLRASFELREYFHLVFLRHLAARLSGRPYALKGGICLRFFHRSQRLSEDIDFDLSPEVAVPTLLKGVDTILESRAFRNALASQGVLGLRAARPKQTETVQRWKVTLNLGGNLTLPTKIEFSRRKETISSHRGVPDPALLQHYKIPLFAAQYYGARLMAAQKVAALAAPSRHAIRDLFDLYHLLSFTGVEAGELLGEVGKAAAEGALLKIRSFTYRDFREQVLPYLTADLIRQYEDEESFERLREKLVRALQESIR